MPNETKRIQKFLKEYFIFSTGERKGIIWLLAILVIVISLPFFYDILFPVKPLEIKVSELKNFEEDQKAVESFPVDAKENKRFTFDPNFATDKELEQLGFTSHNIKTIRNYVSKGGKFREPADVKKIFGIKPELYQKLEPFIVINPQQKTGQAFTDSTKRSKSAKKIVELNGADSAELVALYRIGPAIAGRIIGYRNKLGGFLNLQQLTEIWGFDEDILFDLEGKISVDPGKAKIYDLNVVTAEELKAHPYFKYKLSNAIINYRKQHGNFSKMEDLKNIVIVNDSVYKRISLYLKLN